MQRTERIDLRVSSQDKKALQAVAELQGTTVSNFVLSTALKAANDELADRRLFKMTLPAASSGVSKEFKTI
jgi:uncharacterized protein (DUF1778 family)